MEGQQLEAEILYDSIINCRLIRHLTHVSVALDFPRQQNGLYDPKKNESEYGKTYNKTCATSENSQYWFIETLHTTALYIAGFFTL